MDLEKIQGFIDVAKNAGVKELQYESGKEKIKVTLPYSGEEVLERLSPRVGVQQESRPAPQSASSKNEEEGLITVTSPFVGTFYSSPSPDAPPYVKKGDRVSPGQVLCIIEAMKIMNEIECDVSGEVVEVLVENENYVEFGQVLFKIRP